VTRLPTEPVGTRISRNHFAQTDPVAVVEPDSSEVIAPIVIKPLLLRLVAVEQDVFHRRPGHANSANDWEETHQASAAPQQKVIVRQPPVEFEPIAAARL